MSFWKRQPQQPAPTYPTVTPNITEADAGPIVQNAVDFAIGVAAICAKGTPEEVRAALSDDTRRTALVEFDYFLDALATISDAHPDLAEEIEPLALKLTKLQLYISGV